VIAADCTTATAVDPTGNKTFQVCNEGSVRVGNATVRITHDDKHGSALLLCALQVCIVVCFAPASSAPMHRTKSIDYAVVLEGEIELELDNGVTRLVKTGYL